MSNSVFYNSMPTSKPPQPVVYSYHHHHHHHQTSHQSSHQSSPVPQIQNVASFSNHLVSNTNNNHYQTLQSHQTLPSANLLNVHESSAYFLDRVDLENYSADVLQQTVENVLTTTQSRGLKVKLSLPDDGLIINNITDPNQSWIFKKSELLYFWRDPQYLNIIVVVTKARSRRHSTIPYSASIFRLRGNETIQTFLQRAQMFFANLSVSTSSSHTSRSSRHKSVDKLVRIESKVNDEKLESIQKSKSKSHSNINDQSPTIKKRTTPNRERTPHTVTVIRRVTRAEFDPGKAAINSANDNKKNRTYSDTNSSTDSQATNSTREISIHGEKTDEDEDDKMTTLSNNFTSEQIGELMRELKQLRNEIATLKLETRIQTSTRSMSTSPLAVETRPVVKERKDSSTTTSPTFTDVTSQSEIDAETQTDFSLIQSKRKQLSRKNKKIMIESNDVSTTTTTSTSTTTKKNNEQSQTRNGRNLSTSSTSAGSEQESTSLESSSQMDSLSHDTSISLNQEPPPPPQPTVSAAPPRPVLRNQSSFIPLNNSTSYTIPNDNPMVSDFNSMEEGSLPLIISTTIEKEVPTFLSTNIPSSNSEIISQTIPIITVGPTNFQPLPENSKLPVEHIYENVPIIIQQNSNRDSYHNIPIINVDEQQKTEQTQNKPNGYVYCTVKKSPETETQNMTPEQSTPNANPVTDNDSSENQPPVVNVPTQKPQIISTGRHRNQPVYFANHLTNPIFNIDKQLLINTVANQFGVDLHSPQLQQLVTNQHLFAARKRTFANMVWQMTPDEETALCSPTSAPTNNAIEVDTIESEYSSSRSILKANNTFQSTPKRRNISWDSNLG